MSLCQLFDLCRNVLLTLLSLAQVITENLTLIFSMEYCSLCVILAFVLW